jgi:hypothetical protein
MAKPKGSAPWMPTNYDIADTAALQAMKRGEATPDQQVRAMEFILAAVCDRHGMSYRPDNQFDTAFAEGKRWVANQIVKICSMPLSQLRKDNAQ